jgi:RNA polymerase sigma factor (sigma-70 family)
MFGYKACHMQQMVEEQFDDQELAARCKEGDQDAWEMLHRRYGGLVFQRCYAATGDYDEAEDVSQKVWVRVFRFLPEFRFQSSFKTWLYSIVQTRIADWIEQRVRRRGREVPVESGVEGEEGECSISCDFADEENDPAAIVASQEDTESALGALRKLSEDCQRILRLRYSEEMGDKEIAALLGLGEQKHKTVESRRFRCKKEFERQLKEISA